MSQELAEDEESYYEEEEVEVTITEEEEDLMPPMETPARPPHPLFGGEGRNALLDQIKARGQTPVSVQGKSSGSSVSTKPAPAIPAPKPTPALAPKPAGQLSMAEQVALMAAKRQQRMEGTDNGGGNERVIVPAPSDSARTQPTQPVTAPAPVSASVDSRAAATKTTTTVTAAPTTTVVKSVKRLPKPTTAPTVVKSNNVTSRPAPSSVEAAAPVVIKSYIPDPIPPLQNQNSTSTTQPIISQAILKPTGKRDEIISERDTAPETVSAKVKETTQHTTSTETGPTTVDPETGEVITTTRTKTVTTTKRVIKTTPEYDETEYKVGCFCTVM